MDYLELRLDDDPETLRTALEMIDATIDTHLEGDASVGSVEDAVEDQHSTQTKSNRRKRSPRDDIIKLRQQVVQLQSKLIRLRSQGERTELSSYFLKQSKPQTVWKECASQQWQHRRDAEVENKKLQLMLRSQMMVGQRLLALLRRGDAKKASPKGPDSAPCGQSCCRQSREEQDRQARELFAHVDQVFIEECFKNQQSSFYDIQTKAISKNESIVDTRAGWIISCASDRVAEVLWASMTHVKGSMICKRLRMDVEELGDTLLTSFTVSATAGSDSGTCTGTALYRRHLMGDSTVAIVSVMGGEMLANTSTSRDAIIVSEEQVMRIRPTQSPDGVTQTQVHITRQLRLSFAADHSTLRQSIVNATVELMLLRIEDEITLKQELVEELGQ